MNTWSKKVKVDNKMVSKRKVLDYYRKLWKEDKTFKDTVKKKGLFVRSSFGKKSVIRRKGIKINNITDLEKVVNEHAVELITPVKNTKANSLVDIDIPRSQLSNKKKISRSIVKRLKEKDIDVALVTDSPRGSHIFCRSKKPKLKKALKEIASEDKKLYVGKSSKDKVVLDAGEPAVALPNSLSIKGKPYKKWDEF